MVLHKSNVLMRHWDRDSGIMFGRDEIRQCKNADDFVGSVVKFMMENAINNADFERLHEIFDTTLIVALKLWAASFKDGCFIMGFSDFKCCYTWEIGFLTTDSFGRNHVQPVLANGMLAVPQVHINIEE